ncbi:hypothetical protein PTSG_03190 [Salpingoeca rosetta]|uniref:Uncharacterized protein n=1 Tax=Salpingoeca rosetta (strain ATCC 50818 / BSB-021) TaxID=946362 RepID=F2U4H2_SALR5|nr:uncharacterized protein PTSG_03190 [Salpingoeca rosetta]EGD82538.1 hypothetical protein PTSG_03190 [Salpingoeca rosetta]|eukprot:XP_004995774.1 hypothetical protein PTSG_03190 [Salpingoeca rosetta]
MGQQGDSCAATCGALGLQCEPDFQIDDSDKIMRFRFPVSGFTHIDTTEGVKWSAYRFHEMDPLPFSDGFKLQWRNGDMDDKATGLKCYTLTGGNVVGNPTNSTVTSYAWVYVW